jgi:hypothetical protein
MSPAERQRHFVAAAELVVAGIAIDLQDIRLGKGISLETGYVDADRSRQLEITLADGPGHLF